MTKIEIKAAARQYGNTKTKPEAGYILNSYLAFEAGANYVNERQPYTEQDIKMIAELSYNDGRHTHSIYGYPRYFEDFWNEHKEKEKQK